MMNFKVHKIQQRPVCLWMMSILHRSMWIMLFAQAKNIRARNLCSLSTLEFPVDEAVDEECKCTGPLQKWKALPEVLCSSRGWGRGNLRSVVRSDWNILERRASFQKDIKVGEGTRIVEDHDFEVCSSKNGGKVGQEYINECSRTT